MDYSFTDIRPELIPITGSATANFCKVLVVIQPSRQNPCSTVLSASVQPNSIASVLVVRDGLPPVALGRSQPNSGFLWIAA